MFNMDQGQFYYCLKTIYHTLIKNEYGIGNQIGIHIGINFVFEMTNNSGLKINCTNLRFLCVSARAY